MRTLHRYEKNTIGLELILEKPMEDKTWELLNALRNYHYAKTAHDEAMAECEVSWGYRGHVYITALVKAEKEIGEKLISLIDERINERLRSPG